jgi:hypothetical protein
VPWRPSQSIGAGGTPLPPLPRPPLDARWLADGGGDGGASGAIREELEAELEAQQAKVHQLQQQLHGIYQPGGRPPESTGAAFVAYDHAENRYVPPTTPSQEHLNWQVPDGTAAGQVFEVNGEYYVAVPRGQQQHHQLPPLAPR